MLEARNYLLSGNIQKKLSANEEDEHGGKCVSGQWGEQLVCLSYSLTLN